MQVLGDKKDWRAATRAMRELLQNPKDTVQVFKIMAALNAGTSTRNYRRLLTTQEGGRVAYRRLELVEQLRDADFLGQFGQGTVGAAYRAFLERTGYSAQGLADVSEEVERDRAFEHPFAWFGRRERDLHDIWHVLTGYKADDPLGELCLVAFSFAQSKGLGWAFIAISGAIKSLTEPHGFIVARAVWEGYRHGQRARWLHEEDIEILFAEPLDAARKRLNILRPTTYERALQTVGVDSGASWLAAQA